MKKMWLYFAAGCVLAVIGMFLSDICGDFFTGMDYGSACVLGMGMYLCVVVVTCTGVIISHIGSKPAKGTSDKKDT